MSRELPVSILRLRPSGRASASVALPPLERRIAILETDPHFRRQMAAAFSQDGWRQRSYSLGQSLLKDLQRFSPHVVVSCTRMTDLRCEDNVSAIRKAPPGVYRPELVLTDRLPPGGLSQDSAWAYSRALARPFTCQDLLRHVESVLTQPFLQGLVGQHQLHAESKSLVEMGSVALEVHQAQYISFHDWQHRHGRVWLAGREIHTSLKEYRLAEVFFQRIGLRVPRSDLAQAAWAEEPPEDSRTVDAHVSRLRNRLSLTESAGFRLQSRYKSGYQLDYIS